jgi:2-amino-4-hydroxy-6-hydroxymethyldihydropteridine diphosphokinase
VTVGTGVGIYIALGSNLGDRAAIIQGALRDLADDGRSVILRVSSLHETAPDGGPAGQSMFLNGAAAIETVFSAAELMNRLLEIEKRYGRTRSMPNAPRTLDLDLLVYGDQVFRLPGLAIPHPRMWKRSFVMLPLREICPDAELDRIARRLISTGRGDELSGEFAARVRTGEAT